MWYNTEASKNMFDSKGYEVFVKFIESNLYGWRSMLNIKTFMNTNIKIIIFSVH